MIHNRPSIFQIGTVTEVGDETHVKGWGLGLCIAKCGCHRDPKTGQLGIAQDEERGLLGLTRHYPCYCCGPWTSRELSEIVRSFRQVEDMPSVAEPDPTEH